MCNEKVGPCGHTFVDDWKPEQGVKEETCSCCGKLSMVMRLDPSEENEYDLYCYSCNYGIKDDL